LEETHQAVEVHCAEKVEDRKIEDLISEGGDWRTRTWRINFHKVYYTFDAQTVKIS